MVSRGIYFWENNLDRAWSWARQTFEPKGIEFAVVGAVLDLGYCLNLTEEANLNMVKQAYQDLEMMSVITGTPLPKNKDIENEGDKLYRPLDFAVIEHLHKMRQDANETMFDSTKGIFLIEGAPLYPTAGIREKSHIQICIRNPNCIKGYFSPLPFDAKYPNP